MGWLRRWDKRNAAWAARANDEWAKAPKADGVPVERPGVGLALVGVGVLVGLVGLLALPWAEGYDDPTLLDIRDSLSNHPEPTEVVPDIGWYYVSWAGFATFAVVTLFALVAAVGLRSGATTVARTLGVLAAIGGGVVHYLGVWQLFEYGGEAADAGPWAMYLAYGLVVAGSAIGPRTVVTGPAPAPPPPPMPYR